MGAVKANIRHSEAAAGISSLLKALLVYQHNVMPLFTGIKTKMNPTIPGNLEARNVHLPRKPTPWLRSQRKKRLALVNSFGAHGGNSTVLLEDGPEKEVHAHAETLNERRESHVVAISAKCETSLEANIKHLALHLEQHPDTSVTDLSYTLCARRMHHNFRVATTVSTVAGLQNFFSYLTKKDYHSIPAEAPSTLLTFTGQGALLAGVCEDFLETFPLLKAQVLQLDRIVQRLGFPSVISTLSGLVDQEVDSPVENQLSIVVLEIALARLWSYLGVLPSAVIGHSLGEYSALAVSGILSVTDVLNLVGKRAKLIQRLCTPYSHAMLSVRASALDAKHIIEDSSQLAGMSYEISCLNTRKDIVLGGAKSDVDAIRQVLESASMKAVPLQLPYAFNTSQMDAVVNELETLASEMAFKAPSTPFISTLLGQVVYDSKTIDTKYLAMQMRQSGRFCFRRRGGHGHGPDRRADALRGLRTASDLREFY